jgi:hypothetical protein
LLGHRNRLRDRVLAALETEVAYAPALWRLEMANLVLKLERRKFLTPKEAEAVIETAAKLRSLSTKRVSA